MRGWTASDVGDQGPAAPSPSPRRRFLAGLGLGAAVAGSGPLARPALAGPRTRLKIAGTGASLGGMRLLGDAFSKADPAVDIEIVTGLGTQGGIRALAAGAVDLAVAARGATAEERGAGLRSTLYAATPLAFATHPATGVEAVGLAQLVAIFSGQTTAWPSGHPVRLVRRPPNDSDTAIVAGLSPEMKAAVAASFARSGLVTAATDHDNLAALEAAPGSLGTASLCHVATERRAVRLLALDGNEPSVEALAAGRYPMAKSLHLVAREARDGAVEAFCGFVHGPEAAPLLRANGHLPAADARAGRDG